MLLTEYKEAETMELFREEGREEGRAEGETRGILKTLAGLVRDGILSVMDAASRAGLTEREFTAQMDALGI